MVHRFQKEYFEEYARLAMEDIFPITLRHRENPDLICKDRSIGIEVTRDISPYEGQCYAVFQREYNGDNEFEQMQAMAGKINPKFMGTLSNIDNVIAWNNSQLSGILEKVQETIKCIKNKIWKLKSYEQCTNNCLFIFSDHVSTPNDFRRVINNIDVDITFDKIFIFAMVILFEYNTKTKLYKEYNTTEEQRKTYQKRALQFQDSINEI